LYGIETHNLIFKHDPIFTIDCRVLLYFA